MAILAVLAAPALGDEPSSPSFDLRQSSTNAAGGTSVSPSFRVTGTLAGEPADGVSAGPTFVLQSGFWSFAGALSVPVVLHVARNEVTPQRSDLKWSGNAPPYEVFVANDCAVVFDHLYTTTSNNFLLAIPSPPPNRLTCFDVVPMTTAAGTAGAER